MAFLEELGKTLTDTGKEVATKAKALTETIQLKTQISTEKTKLEEAYAAIGRIYYESNREPEEAYAKVYDAVKACRERIAALEIELTQSEGSRICASAAQRFRRIPYTAANAVLRLRKKRRKAKMWMLLRKNRRLLRKKQSAQPAFLRRKRTHLFRRKSIKHNQKE